MPRPKRCRRIGAAPGSTYFKPRGIPLSGLDEVVLGVDEFEAIRLADLEGLYQELAAEKMSVSRQTFGRIIAAAHHKVAEALVRGKALKIEGGCRRACRGENVQLRPLPACVGAGGRPRREYEMPFLQQRRHPGRRKCTGARQGQGRR